MFCDKCGYRVPRGSGLCQKCGAKPAVDWAQQPKPSDSVTLTSLRSKPHALNQPDPPAQQFKPGLTKKNTKHTPLEWFVGSRFGLTPIWVIGLILGFLVGGTAGSVIHWVVIAIMLIRVGLKLKSLTNQTGPKASIPGILQDVLIVIILIALVAGLSGRIGDSGGGSGISGNDRYVQMVKGGTLDGYPHKTVGSAFDDFLSDPKWESGSGGGQRFVNVRGGMLYLDEEVEIVVQFIINEDDETFAYNAVEMNGLPQTHRFFWDLLEAIYDDGPTSSSSQGGSNAAAIGDRIIVGETQPYNNEFSGNLEVTLEYVEFVDQIEDPLFGIYTLPDEGHIFLRAVFTTQNIDTERGGLVPGSSKVVYDGIYEFNHHTFEGDFDANPLSPPVTGLINYMVPVVVAESDNSLVIEFFESMAGGDNVSFVIRSGASDSTSQGTSGGNVSGPITEDEARAALQAWVDSHPFDMPSELGPRYDFDNPPAEGFYQYFLDVERLSRFEILVDIQTGEMFVADGYDVHGVEPLDDWYRREHGGVAQSAPIDDVLYKGIEVSLILDERLEYTVGTPQDSRGPYYFYDGMEIYYNDYVDFIIGTNLSLFEINGLRLDMSQSELIAAFGRPVEYYEYPDYIYNASDYEGRTMRYHVSAYIIDYMIDFWFDNPNDASANNISIRRMGQ